MTESPGVRPPVQARSQRTFVALLDATAELLEERLFSDVSVQDIVNRAGSSAGSFYARFDNKQALLGALQDRLHDAMDSGPESIPDSWVRGEVSARSIAEAYVDNMTADHRSNEGLIRALMTEAQSDHTIINKSVLLHRKDSEVVGPYLKAPGRSESEKANAVEAASTVLIAVLNQRMMYKRKVADDPVALVPGNPGDPQTRDGLVDLFLAALDL